MEDLKKFSDYQLKEFIEAYKINLFSLIKDWEFDAAEYKHCRETIKEFQEELSRRLFN